MAEAERWAELVGRASTVGAQLDGLLRDIGRVPEWPADRSRQFRSAVHEAALAMRRATTAAAAGLELAQIAARAPHERPRLVP